MTTDQTAINENLHQTGDFVADYGGRDLRPGEVVVIARYSQALSGRVLEVGCGGGRLLGYLVALGGEVHGIDVSPLMIDHCRAVYPEATVRVADVRELTPETDGYFDAIFAGYNIVDVFDPETRIQVLDRLGKLLKPAGLLIFSSHNLAHIEGGGGRGSSGPGAAAGGRAKRMLSQLDRPPSFYFKAPKQMRDRVRNQRRLRPLERHEKDYAIINDVAYNYGALHYYIRHVDQERQLNELGLELIDCVDLEGRTVARGEDGRGPELHYIARPRAAAG